MKFLALISICSVIFSQEIKFATLAPKGSAWYNVMKDFADAVNKETQGRVKFKIYAGGVQGDEISALKRIRIGQIDAGGFIGPGLGQIVPEIRILDMPFMFSDYVEVDYVLKNTKEYFRQKFADKDFYMLAWSEAGFVNVFSKDKIENFSDMKNTKLFALSGDPVSELTFQALKLTPQVIPLTDVLTSLETGDINATYTPPLGAISLQWYRKQKYFINVNLAYASGAVVIKMDKWNKLSDADKKTMNMLADKYFDEFKRVGRKGNEESIETCKKQGLLEVKVKDMKPFLEAGMQARQMGIGKLYDKQLLEKIDALIKESKKK